MIFIGLLHLAFDGYGQEVERRRRSFIGGSLGIAIPRGDFASKDASSSNPSGFAKTGIHIKLVQAALVFKNNFGIAGSWYGSANELQTDLVTGSLGQVWGYGGILIGPMYTIPTKKMNIDFKTGIGYTVATILESSFVGIFRNQGETSTTLAMSFGMAVRYHISPKASLMWEIDFFRSDVRFEKLLNGARQRIRAANLVFGAAIRI